jgi:hypothetical protein
VSLIVTVSLTLAGLMGLATGVLGTIAYYEHLSLQRRQYESETEQTGELLLMLAASQRARPIKPTDR